MNLTLQGDEGGKFDSAVLIKVKSVRFLARSRKMGGFATYFFVSSTRY